MSLYNVKITRVKFALESFRIQENCTNKILSVLMGKHIRINPIMKYLLKKDVSVTKDNFWKLYNPWGGNPEISHIIFTEFPKSFKVLVAEDRFFASIQVSSQQLKRLELASKADTFVLLSETDMRFVVLWEEYKKPYTERHYFLSNVQGL